MSEDLIKRSDAIKAIRSTVAQYVPFLNGINMTLPLECETALRSVPSADRPQGEWIESFKRVETRRGAYLGTKFVHDGWSCSECSEVVEKRYPNCPYCLARMKGVSDE